MGRSLGWGNGNPLQYSCLENTLDRVAWWTTVYGVAVGLVNNLNLSHSSFLFSYLLSSVFLFLDPVAWNLFILLIFALVRNLKKIFLGQLVIYTLCLEISSGKSKGSLSDRHPGCQLIIMTSFLEYDVFFPDCSSSHHQQIPQSPSSFCLLPGPKPRLYILGFYHVTHL